MKMCQMCLPERGVTLVEAVIAIAVFTIIGVGSYNSLIAAMKVVRTAREVVTMTALANEHIETIRNLPFEDVGIVAGVPSGLIPHTQTRTHSGRDYDIITTIRNIDDPFDGIIGETPNDLSPADYKMVEVEMQCPTCPNVQQLIFNTYVAPLALETTSTNGSLFVEVLDASGFPVQGADVHIENNAEIPAIIIDDVTNNSGLLQVVDTIPGVEAYEVTVSKAGYSSAQTYAVGEPANPNPKKPHSTVALQTLTEISLTIDKTSSLDVSSINSSCGAVGGIDFDLEGGTLIGTGPDVYNYSAPHTTDGSGELQLADMQWGTYNLTLTDGTYYLAGTIPLFPLALNPDIDQPVTLVVENASPNGLLVTVHDGATDLPLSNAEVLVEGAFGSSTKTTGVGFYGQTDWSGPSGQASFGDPAGYFDETNIETSSPAGDIILDTFAGEYYATGSLTSSTFDMGTSSNFETFSWLPVTQPVETGADSVKFQVATNNDDTTWDYIGPDGTSGSFYTVSNQNMSAAHDGSRYLRYRAYLETASTTFTPTVSDATFTYTSGCIPPGQVYFDGLADEDYDITVTRSGYTSQNEEVTVDDPWQEHTFDLVP